MSKLEKREQKNLETALFRAKERVIELEESVQQQKFVVDSTYVSGCLDAISDLFPYDEGTLHADFVFGKIPKHKRIKDFSDKSQFEHLLISESRDAIEPVVCTWFEEKIKILIPRFLNFKNGALQTKLNTQQSECFLETLKQQAHRVSNGIALSLINLAKNVTEAGKEWSIYLEKREMGSLIFDFKHLDAHLQCAFQIVDEIYD